MEISGSKSCDQFKSEFKTKFYMTNEQSSQELFLLMYNFPLTKTLVDCSLPCSLFTATMQGRRRNCLSHGAVHREPLT